MSVSRISHKLSYSPSIFLPLSIQQLQKLRMRQILINKSNWGRPVVTKTQHIEPVEGYIFRSEFFSFGVGSPEVFREILFPPVFQKKQLPISKGIF